MESKHPNQLPQIYQCAICSEGFPRQSELRDHLYNVHGETALRQHRQPNSQQHAQLLNDQDKTSFVCKECGQTFIEKSEWISHQNDQHLKFNCVKCDFHTSDREVFTVHCSVEHDNFRSGITKVQLYLCRQCSSTFNSIDGLQEHMQKDHLSDSSTSLATNGGNGAGESQITTTGESDTHQKSYDDQEKTASKMLNCGLCAFILTNIEALRQHMSEVHGMDKKFFYCNHCSAKFMNDKGLRVHLFRMHDVRDESIPLNIGVSLLKPVQQTSTQQTNSPSKNDENLEKQVGPQDECNLCHTVYKNNDQLKLHMQLAHAENTM